MPYKCISILFLLLITASTAFAEYRKIVKVFRPIKNRIFFAGEHASIDHPATMEGAVESGEATARMIARVLKASIKEKRNHWTYTQTT